MDNPLFLSVAFHPRSDTPGGSAVPNARDGTIDVDGTVKLGYRWYPNGPPSREKPVFVYFHGNAEICSDYDHGIEHFHGLDASLLVIDFRGYGWGSADSPKLSTLLSDAEQVVPALPRILEEFAGSPLLLFGRSIGSTCAVHLASKFMNSFEGIVIESGLTMITELPMVQQLSVMLPNGAAILASIPDIFQQCHKLGAVTLPLLVMHGEDDTIAPISQGQDMYDAAVLSANRSIRRFAKAGHNNLTVVYTQEYFAQLRRFIGRVNRLRTLNLNAEPLPETAASSPTLTPVPAAVEDFLDEAIEQAKSLLEMSLYKEAASCCTAALRRGGSARAMSKVVLCECRAKSYAKLGRWADVVDDCSTVMNLEPPAAVQINVLYLCILAGMELGMKSAVADQVQTLKRLLVNESVSHLSAEEIEAFLMISLASTRAACGC